MQYLQTQRASTNNVRGKEWYWLTEDLASEAPTALAPAVFQGLRPKRGFGFL